MGFKTIETSCKNHRIVVLLLVCVFLLSALKCTSAEDQNKKQVLVNLDKLCRTSPFARICRGAPIAKKNIIDPLFDQPKSMHMKRIHFCREHALHPRCRGAPTSKRDIVDNFNEDYGLAQFESDSGIDRANFNDAYFNNPLLGELLREAVEKASSEYDEK